MPSARAGAETECPACGSGHPPALAPPWSWTPSAAGPWRCPGSWKTPKKCHQWGRAPRAMIPTDPQPPRRGPEVSLWHGDAMEAAAGSIRAARQSPPGHKVLLISPAGSSLLHTLCPMLRAARQHKLNPGTNCQNQHGFLKKLSSRKKKEKWMETNSKACS